MENIIKALKNIDKKTVTLIKKRLAEFKALNRLGNDEWFSELCFCILTANSKAVTGIAIQKELGFEGLYNLPSDSISDCIRKNGHRFHNNKTNFIISARRFYNIKDIILDIISSSGESKARVWLVENVKGLGYKEASHFLRNVGYDNLSILDRHILKALLDHNLISDIPKTISKKRYLEIEKIFLELAEVSGVKASELDLMIWYLRTGKVLK